MHRLHFRNALVIPISSATISVFVIFKCNYVFSLRLGWCVIRYCFFAFVLKIPQLFIIIQQPRKSNTQMRYYCNTLRASSCGKNINLITEIVEVILISELYSEDRSNVSLNWIRLYLLRQNILQFHLRKLKLLLPSFIISY